MRPYRFVLFDIDNVLLDWAPAATATFNNIFGSSFQSSDIIRYGFLCEKARNFDRNISDERITAIVSSTQMMSGLPSTPGSIDLVKNLRNLHFLSGASTSRLEKHRKHTVKSLESHFQGLVCRLFMRNRRESKVESKLRSIDKVNPLVFVDDDAQLILELVKNPHIENVHFALVDQPWNRRYTEITRNKNNRVVRFGYWDIGDWRDRDYEWDQMFTWTAKLAEKMEVSIPTR